MPPPRLHLSKSRYLAGLQCPRRLWLTAHAPELATPADAAQEAIFDLGHRIGRRAHELFPGGVLIRDPARRHAEALDETRELLRDPTVPAVFEAVFEHAGVRVHVDALERLPGGAFGLREVKATAGVKDQHRPDVAVQRWVVEGSGVRVASAELAHLDTTYARGPGGIDASRLFRRVELGQELDRESAEVPIRVAEQHALLARESAPDIEPGPHCDQPYSCEFWAHCTRAKPADWIYHMPRIHTGNRFETLVGRGIERICEIPEDFSLNELQARVREAHRSGLPLVSPDLAVALSGLGPPTLYFDLESIAPAEPIYTGTRPYQCIPFQWSLHQADATGALSHRAFLAGGRTDPRREFAETLLAAAGDGEIPVLVWSSFERSTLGDLADGFPDLSARLHALRDRLVDLLKVVRRHVYHPAFLGSFSIKCVAPALAPGFGWGDLAERFGISEGASASAAFERIAAGEATDAGKELRLREALLAYCARDTEALVRVHMALGAGAR